MKIGNVTDVHAAQFPLLCPLINCSTAKTMPEEKMKILIVGANFSKKTITNKEIK
jgi:hypothetical protein